MIPALFIPENRPLSDLLQDFRRSGQHIALVLDEFGGFSGMVTLEDVLELVVGEIEDEFDLEHEKVLVEEARGGFRVAGHLSLRRLEAVLHRTIEQPEDIDSVGGLVSFLSDDDPQPNTVVSWDGLDLEVEAVDRGRATKVLVTHPTRDEEV